MEISWLGHSCFRLKGKEAILITDPFPPTLGYPLVKLKGDIVTLSHHHPGHSYIEAMEGKPKVVDGPGEYEIAAVFITGIRTFHDAEGGKQRGKNTIYLIEMEELVLGHLGDLGHIPSTEQIEEMGNVDVLLVPVGGGATIDATAAAEIIRLLEPRVIIPMHFKTEAVGLALEPVDRFLKEMGVKVNSPQARLSLTKANLPAATEVVVLDWSHPKG